MASFIIEGGHRLSGEIVPQGAKNEALQVLCATLLTDEPVRITNLPDIADVNNQIRLLQDLGVRVQSNAPGDYTFQADRISSDFLQNEAFVLHCASLRGSVMLAGPMLARFGKAVVAKPGGDQIGRRRLDTHFQGLQTLGGDFRYDPETSLFTITAERLRGAYMLLDEASVTGTANIVMASVLAEGTTTIYNAACEPYVQQLCRMLNIGMAAMVGDGIRIPQVSYDQLGIIPDTFRRLGIQVMREGDDIFVPRQDHYEIESFIDGSFMTLADAPWPGLTPDLLSVLLVVSTQAKGSVLIHQKMFESRLFFVDKLIDMGAQIILCDPHRAVVVGHDHQRQLHGGRMTSPDIRAGIALLIAAMSAEGRSQIDNIGQIDRGYQNIEQRLNAIGARIRRIE